MKYFLSILLLIIPLYCIGAKFTPIDEEEYENTFLESEFYGDDPEDIDRSFQLMSDSYETEYYNNSMRMTDIAEDGTIISVYARFYNLLLAYYVTSESDIKSGFYKDMDTIEDALKKELDFQLSQHKHVDLPIGEGLYFLLILGIIYGIFRVRHSHNANKNKI